MLDFLEITTRFTKRSGWEVLPTFKTYPKSKDLLVRGRDFYAVWVEELGMWSTDEDVALALIDQALRKYVEENRSKFESPPNILYMQNSESGRVDAFHKFCQKQVRDSFRMLDEELIFANTETKRENYASKKLPYPLEAGDISAYDKLIGTLYTPEERHKLEWAIGSIVSGDSKTIQKFIVLYGAAGAGKSTFLNIVEQLFEGYYSVFDAKALGSNNNSFALESFKTNPLVAIQHDGDLSRIEDNTRLNSLVSHERMVVNEKFKGQYENRFKCFLFMGTNRPVKITDAKSGLLRRLIDVTPSGKKVSAKEYRTLTKQISFELGHIAQHCLEVYLEDPGYYDDYIPKSMMGASNDFYNFVCDSFSVFKREDGTTLKASWEMYKVYMDEAKLTYPLNKRTFKEELKNYFWNYDESVDQEDGTKLRSYYSRFKTEIFEADMGGKEREKRNQVPESKPTILEFNETISIFDKEFADCLAQTVNEKGTPSKKWENVKTKLSDIDTSTVHYVKVPENHIVIDFDIKDENGEKSFEKNVVEASKWPPTYAELSKSGGGIHLHYIYNGDVSQLSRVYDDDIEIKIFTGGSSLRRRLTKCNDLPIATISSGLPLKGGDKKMMNFDGLKSERALRTLLKRHINKEIMISTAPSVQMISKVLQEAYDSGLCYDVSDLKNAIYALAASSTNQSDECIKLVNEMKFKSEEASQTSAVYDELVFYDIEVFPNLFLVNWKIAGEGKPVVRMVNPKPSDIEELIKFKLVGFNNRDYDNHMLYGCLMGYNNEQLYNLSKRLINKDKSISRAAKFREAYNLSYTDVYDFSSAVNKQSLKKWEIQLGITHHELGLDWDEPVPEELWTKVAEYCDDDVLATEKVFYHLKGDWIARQILAELTGMTVNDTTNTLTTRFIFGSERNPQLVYTDLATGKQYYTPDREADDIGTTALNAFEGYEYVYSEKDKKYHNMYRETDIGRGGYIISNAGIYGNVALLDIESLHPSSLIAMNYFGEFTQHYAEMKSMRILIKHGDFESAKKLMDGKLAKYLDDPSTAKDLSNALKTVLNSTYGLTSASFANAMKHPMNMNNIVALRGALFMRTLQDEVEKRGYKIVAIKTDSIKIADADKSIIDFCMEFAKKYSYKFEFEACYDRMCQINDADYVAKYKDPKWCEANYGFVPGDNTKHPNGWTATGKKFQTPYVFKKLFSHEEIKFNDLCNVFSVQGGALYLDMNEKLPDISEYEKEFDKLETKYKKGLLSDNLFEPKCAELLEKMEVGHDYHFVGRVGQFCPIKPGFGGGELLVKRNDKYDSAARAKGFRWLEAETIRQVNEDTIDDEYFRKLIDDSVDVISKYGDFEWFISDDPYIPEPKLDLDIPEDVNEELPFV